MAEVALFTCQMPSLTNSEGTEAITIMKMISHNKISETAPYTTTGRMKGRRQRIPQCMRTRQDVDYRMTER